MWLAYCSFVTRHARVVTSITYTRYASSFDPFKMLRDSAKYIPLRNVESASELDGLFRNKFPATRIKKKSNKNGCTVCGERLKEIILALHPIAFMISSFETVYDFNLYYKGLLALAELPDLDLDPESCDASYNAARQFFPNATILMCWFHVQQNV